MKHHENRTLRMVPLGKRETGTNNRLGFMAGEFSVPDDFDKMSDDGIVGMFEGKVA